MATFFKLALLLLSAIAVATALPIGKITPSPVKCSLCTHGLNALRPLFRTNVSVEILETAFIPVCLKLHGVGYCEGEAPCMDLCKGIVREFGEEVVTIFMRNGNVGTEELCELINVCEKKQPPSPPLPVAGPGLIIRSNLSDLSGEKDWPQWKRNTNQISSSSSSSVYHGSFLHITDFHIDLDYTAGTNAECGEPLCCRQRYGPPPAGKRAAGSWGDFNCDTSPKLSDATWKFVVDKMAANVDFAIVTGDEPPHDIWMQSQQSNTRAIDNVSQNLLSSLHSVPTFPAIGNHASFPVDQFQENGKESWLFDDVARDWAPWLPNDAVSTLKRGGFYAARARPGVRMVVLHTTVLTADDFWLKVNVTPHDFTGQLAWFNDTLDQVRALKERALVIGHARPTGFVEPLKSAFYEIAWNNRDIIDGYLFGHSHTADLSLMRRSDSEPPFAVCYTAGSVTPYTNLNPGMRHWKYDEQVTPSQHGNDVDSVSLVGWDQYWFDLKAANEANNASWTLQYSSPPYFDMPALSPLDWQNMAQRLVNDSSLNFRWNDAVNKRGPRSEEKAGNNACDILQLANCPYH